MNLKTKKDLFAFGSLTFPLIGAAVGAGIGEIADHLPYISHAVPYLVDSALGKEVLYQNIDKLGALLGFVDEFFVKSPYQKVYVHDITSDPDEE